MDMMLTNTHPAPIAGSSDATPKVRVIHGDRYGVDAARPVGPAHPLFLVHGEPDAVRRTEALLPYLDLPVYALPSPGHETPRLRTIEGMATWLVRMVRAAQPRGPYRIAGWDFGGVLAYEIASQLVGEDEVVEFVGLLDTGSHVGVAGDGASRDYLPCPIPVPVHLFSARGSAGDDVLRRLLATGDESLSVASATDPKSFGALLSQSLRDAAGRRSGEPADAYSPLLTLQFGSAAAAPLACVPGAGGNVVGFAELAMNLDPVWTVYGLQPRGTASDMVPHTSVQAAAACYLRALQRTPSTGSVHLLGHSFGGWVAFEMARQLGAAGQRVASLTLLDTDAPANDPAGIDEWDSSEAFLRLVDLFELAVERSLEIGRAEVESSDHLGRLALLHAKLVQHGLLPLRSRADSMRHPLRTFSTCLRTHYCPTSVYPDPVRLVLLRDTRLDESANLLEFSARVERWKRWAPKLSTSIGPGNHMTAMRQPHVHALVSHLAFADTDAEAAAT